LNQRTEWLKCKMCLAVGANQVIVDLECHVACWFGWSLWTCGRLTQWIGSMVYGGLITQIERAWHQVLIDLEKSFGLSHMFDIDKSTWSWLPKFIRSRRGQSGDTHGAVYLESILPRLKMAENDFFAGILTAYTILLVLEPITIHSTL